MKKNFKTTFLSLGLLAIFSLPVIALAISGDTAYFPNPVVAGSIKELLTKILDLIVQIGVIAVTGGIIYSGFLYVMARGNSAQITKAHQAFYSTIIGAVIVLGAFAIAKVVGDTAKQVVGQAQLFKDIIRSLT